VVLTGEYFGVIFFFSFCERCFEKKEYFVANSLFWEGAGSGGGEIAKTRILKNFHHCLQYERVLKKFYFHIFNLVKFGFMDDYHLSNIAKLRGKKTNIKQYLIFEC
jgi:hypothetical protein